MEDIFEIRDIKLDGRFWIGNISLNELIEDRAQLLHDKLYHRGYYYVAARDISGFIGFGNDGRWMVDILKVVHELPSRDPVIIARYITPLVLEEVSHAIGNVSHKTQDEAEKWRDFLLNVAYESSE